MNINIIDVRRFIRNRIEYYAHFRDCHCVGINDGCPLTLRQLGECLAIDPEPFPWEYEPAFRKLCGSAYPIWRDKRRTYGDVIAVLNQKLAEEEARAAFVGGGSAHHTSSDVGRS